MLSAHPRRELCSQCGSVGDLNLVSLWATWAVPAGWLRYLPKSLTCKVKLCPHTACACLTDTRTGMQSCNQPSEKLLLLFRLLTHLKQVDLSADNGFDLFQDLRIKGEEQMQQEGRNFLIRELKCKKSCIELRTNMSVLVICESWHLWDRSAGLGQSWRKTVQIKGNKLQRLCEGTDLHLSSEHKRGEKSRTWGLMESLLQANSVQQQFICFESHMQLKIQMRHKTWSFGGMLSLWWRWTLIVKDE